MMNNKKMFASVASVAFAGMILLGGTFAWQSIDQRALNEASDIINPGGRLHDDFNGEDKNVYVENFGEEPIFARVQLGEFLALTNNKGNSAVEKTNVVIGSEDESGNRTYRVRLYDAGADTYWDWTMGGSTVYMPTFNKNKDSLAADINGTYLGPDGIVTEDAGDDRYEDYVTYSIGENKTGTEIYDADTNSLDEVGTDLLDLGGYVSAGSITVLEDKIHTAKPTRHGNFISMAKWLGMVKEDGGYDADLHGDHWVYDVDGWVYWAGAILPDSATGLLLDHIERSEVMDDSWYYAIEVKAQFVTADDIGKDDNTGFYDTQAGTAPTAEAEELLDMITRGYEK